MADAQRTGLDATAVTPCQVFHRARRERPKTAGRLTVAALTSPCDTFSDGLVNVAVLATWAGIEAFMASCDEPLRAVSAVADVDGFAQDVGEQLAGVV